MKEGLQKFKDWDVKIIDTSGRNAIDSSLTKEITDINGIAKPDEVVLILDATIGKLYRMDSLEVKEDEKRFIFYFETDGSLKPNEVLSRLLGMGDFETLMAAAKEFQNEIDENCKEIRIDFSA